MDSASFLCDLRAESRSPINLRSRMEQSTIDAKSSLPLPAVLTSFDATPARGLLRVGQPMLSNQLENSRLRISVTRAWHQTH